MHYDSTNKQCFGVREDKFIMMSKMLHIEFEYKDRYTNGKWSKQECECSSLKECKEFYGLGIDCDYRILKIEEVKE